MAANRFGRQYAEMDAAQHYIFCNMCLLGLQPAIVLRKLRGFREEVVLSAMPPVTLGRREAHHIGSDCLTVVSDHTRIRPIGTESWTLSAQRHLTPKRFKEPPGI